MALRIRNRWKSDSSRLHFFVEKEQSLCDSTGPPERSTPERANAAESLGDRNLGVASLEAWWPDQYRMNKLFPEESLRTNRSNKIPEPLSDRPLIAHIVK